MYRILIKPSKTIYIPLISAILLTCLSCNNNSNKTGENADSNKVEIDSTAATIVKFNNALFSIPSPYQISLLVKQVNINYNKDFLNPIDRSTKYTSNIKKALNLGIYGADLGYLNIYEQTPNAIRYFAIIKQFSNELGIATAFDKETLKRIETNMENNNNDSLMYIISNSYRKADSYLKKNDRNNIGVLILAGGWVESLHLMTQIAIQEKNQKEIILRIGEQKHPLDNLIKILSPYYETSPEFTELLDGLIDLAYEFDGIDVTYTYSEPTIDVKNKLTIINSKSDLVIKDDQLKRISEKAKKIRSKIIE